MGTPSRTSPTLREVSLLICGSIASDHLMTFQGRFKDSLVVEQLDKLAVSFLVDELEIRRGGVAPNMCFGLGRLGLRPVLVGAAGEDFTVDYRELAGAARRRLLLRAHLRHQAHRSVHLHDRLVDGAVRVVLCRRHGRGAAHRARADRGEGRCPRLRADRRGRPRGHAPSHARVPAARLPVHRRPEPAAGVQRGRPDPRPHRRRDVPVLQRVRVPHDRVQDRLVDRRGAGEGRRPGDDARSRRRAHHRA